MLAFIIWCSTIIWKFEDHHFPSPECFKLSIILNLFTCILLLKLISYDGLQFRLTAYRRHDQIHVFCILSFARRGLNHDGRVLFLVLSLYFGT